MAGVTQPRIKARVLYEARVTRRPIAPFTDAEPSLGMDDGYAIQRELVAMLLDDGDRVIGYKAGLTSAPMQQMFGVDTPDYGPVLASTLFHDGDTIRLQDFISPKVEAEIVFRLRTRLRGPGVSVDDAREAVGDAIAGLEIVDSRIADWRIGLADTIADLASNGAVVLSGRAVPAADIDPRLITMTLVRNGQVAAAGTGAEALGDPLAVVAWLANTLGQHGVALEPGHLVMTGALHAALPICPGDLFTAEFDRLGPVTLRASATV